MQALAHDIAEDDANKDDIKTKYCISCHEAVENVPSYSE